MSILAWIQTDEFDTVIISLGDGSQPGQFKLFIDSIGELSFSDAGADETHGFFASAARMVADDTKTHIAFVKDGTSSSFYIDGELVKTFSGEDITYDSSSQLYVGGTGEDQYLGTLGDVRLYDSSLTQSEISSICHQSRFSVYSDTSGYLQSKVSLLSSSSSANDTSSDPPTVSPTSQTFVSFTTGLTIQGLNSTILTSNDTACYSHRCCKCI